MASELLLNTGKEGIDKSPVIRSLDLVLSGSGHSGMLTSNTTEHWKAVRKGVAPAFSTANIRCHAAAKLALSTYWMINRPGCLEKAVTREAGAS